MHKEFRADLHCHSNCSDGSMTPKELISHAKEVGLRGLSITDHDSIHAYETAISAAKQEGIALGTGVEFSSVHEGVSVHVLGYDYDLHNIEIQAFCLRHIERRKHRNQKILEKLAKRGIAISMDELETNIPEGHPVGRPHIALTMMQKGFVRSIQEAFLHYLGDGKPCYDPGDPMSTEETIEVIHHAGGKAFIAHPHLLRNGRFVEKLLQKPFDGIECYYAKCPSELEQKWVRLAQQKNLLISGGSDFHGAIKPNIPLGCSWVNQETFESIFHRNRCC